MFDALRTFAFVWYMLNVQYCCMKGVKRLNPVWERYDVMMYDLRILGIQPAVYDLY